jgi:two-component sensor histidine kinase
MSHAQFAAVTSHRSWIEPVCPDRDIQACESDFRQLRHHTKNALQQVLLRIENAYELKTTVNGRRLLADLQRRIMLSARISDALFGITEAPTSISERLRTLCDSTIQMFADDTQVIRLELTVTGDCPVSLQPAVLRVAHEFVANAVKHGMHARVTGKIAVQLTTGIADRTALVITDDGWGFHGTPEPGDGLSIAGDLAASAGGITSLRRTHVTVARLELPSPRVRL